MELTYRKRRYLYRLANAIVAAAVVYGLIEGERAAAVLLVVNAALGLADYKAADVE